MRGLRIAGRLEVSLKVSLEVNLEDSSANRAYTVLACLIIALTAEEEAAVLAIVREGLTRAAITRILG